MNAARERSPRVVPAYALVVTAHEGHARIDRQFAKNARISATRAVATGAMALRVLERQRVDILFVDDQLADMTGWEFLRRLRAHADFKNQPVIRISADGRRQSVLEAIRLGCVGYLVRPYSMEAFCKHLALARQTGVFLARESRLVAQAVLQAEAGDVESAQPVLDRAVNEQADAARHCEQGFRSLAEGRYDQAIENFSAATRLCALMAEAHLGLARCWLAKGDAVRYRVALTRAAEVCAEAERFERYKQEFLTILQKDSSEFNPFLSLALKLGGGRDWEGAHMALQNALWLSPGDPRIHLELAKAHHFRREPEKARECALKAISLGGEDDEAVALYERLTGMSYGRGEAREEEAAPERKRRPDLTMGILNAVLYVAAMVTEGLHKVRRDMAA